MSPQHSSKLHSEQETDKILIAQQCTGYQVTEPNLDNGAQKAENWNCMHHILWINVAWFVFLHLGAVYGIYLLCTSAKLETSLFAIFTYLLCVLGITAGHHRLWSHKAYKAKLPLRIFLAFCSTAAFQNSIYTWVRDHRMHHKYAETDADPHNSKRGFFFSHIGWLCCKKHPDVKKFGEKLDMSDLLEDPVVYYQNKYYVVFMILCCIVIPTTVPWYFWKESLWNAFFVAFLLRYFFEIHVTWSINSVAHMFGIRPYDRFIAAVENYSLAAFSLGEGFHNYHHTFPWDYSAGEWGWRLNMTTFFIDSMAKLGLAYDLRKASGEMIKNRVTRTGDTFGPNCK